MAAPVIGVNVPGGVSMGGLEDALRQITQDGWQAAELNLDCCPLILGGVVQTPVVEYVKSVLDAFPLHYTAHASYGLDLKRREDAQLHRQVLLSSIAVCGTLGIDRFNCHYEEYSHDRQMERQFRERIGEAAALGQTLGVAVNVENIEVEDYRYALDTVAALGHPNCGMTLDLGHLWIAANRFHFDYLEAVEECARYVRHVHLNDNQGRFEPMRVENKHLYNTLSKSTRFPFGQGDVHIPPFWGTAPLGEAIGILRAAGYSGIWLCEYYSHLFHPLNSQIRQRVLSEILARS